MPLFSKNGTRANMLSDPFVHIIIVIVLGFAIYMSTAVAPFAFDDGTTVKKNPALKNMNYFTDRELLDRALENKEIDEHFRNRIIGHLTFALNYKLHGFEVAGYHVFSVLAHLSSSILVYLLMLLTAKTPWFRKVSGIEDDPVSYRITALFAALLFVSHPVQTQAVTYISQRFAALATMLCLLSLVLYIRARQLSRESESLRSKYCMLYAASLFSAILAMKTKEISFTLPVVIALYEAMFFEGNARERLAYLLPLLLTMLIVPVTVLQDRNVLSDIKHFEASFQGGSAENDIMRYLLTQFRVLVTYLRMLVLPLNQNLDYDYPMYHSFFQPPVFLSLLLNAGIFIGGAYLYRRSGREGIKDRQWLRVMAFGIFWFFITLSVESSIIPLADVIFEHRLYLPSAGFFMAVISAAAIGKRRFGKTGAQGVTLFLAFMVLAFSAATFQRNKIWGDGIKLWEDVVRKSSK